MVHVSVKASVQITGGPTLPVDATLESDSYTVASAQLGAANDTGASHTVDLLPAQGGHVKLLALNAQTSKGAGAKVSMTPAQGSTTGKPIAVDGTLLISSVGALEAFVEGGPRSLALKNNESEAVTVDILVCFASSP
jgi:hypothetical protein